MNNTFGKRLKQIRKNKKISQKELADISGVSTPSISSFENGHRMPNLYHFRLICKALEVKSSDLIDF